ncbi:uncharacterized protein LOC119078930 isoform X2 [Bradysia coprophila]|uniref:uncharacterized protein LOC119078930 isoform X2 n=1 Tax=Bradysia coprophila TaxID=38358 RepID=UPI00187D8D90|nr:uncharacterized protein LOC119078930 isoform X2 [Bradysia coprophila]
MNWKVACLTVLIVIGFTSKLSYAEQKLADEDIEETSELVVNYLGPLLELNGFTIEDLPDHLKYLTAKYYLIFSRGDEPLDNLEKMVSDYNIIQQSQDQIAEKFQEHVEHFVKVNESNNKKALKKLITKVLESLNFDLQIVKPRDAITFLLYQEAYPDIMKIVSLMVGKHYDAYLEVRAKEKKPSNDTDPLQQPTDDKGFAAIVRELVASHGRFGLLKRLVTYFEDYIPPVDRKNVDESTLDYLDDLQEFLDAESSSLWRFIKGSGYTGMTDKWIAKAQKFYVDVSTVIPLQEILNIFDAAVLNLNDRRALLILRSEIATSGSYGLTDKVQNAKDVLKLISETVTNDLSAIRDILLATAMEANSEISEDIFLKYLDKILNPHDMSTNDLSTQMLAIISRTFERIKSIKGASATDENTKTLATDLQSFRESLQRIRDTLAILIPEQSESNRIELHSLLQLIVNKFGSFVSERESKLVQFVNGVFGNLDERRKFEEDVSHFALQLETGFSNIPIKPSEFLTEKLLELVEIIDIFVNFTSF